MKMYNRKGQAALEFMMTYGWAILVVLAAIGALSYFGILDPSRFTPDTCLAGSGFACPGKPIVNATTMTFTIVNGLGYNVIINTTNSTYPGITGPFLKLTNIPCNRTFVCPQGTQCTTQTASGSRNYTVQDGSGATIFSDQCNFGNTNVVKGEYNLMYKNVQSGLTETLKVSVTSKPK